MKPCTRRVPKLGQKTIESCNVQNSDNQEKGVVGAHMREYGKKWQTTPGQSQLGYAVW